MKKLLAILIIFQISILSAQETLEVTEVNKSFSQGNQTAFRVTIPQSKLKEVISGWKKYIRKNNKSDFKEMDGEYILSKSIIPDISNDSITMYSIFNTGNGTDIELNIFVSNKDSVFISTSSDSKTSTNIRDYLRKFAVEQYRVAIENELEVEERKLKIYQSDLKELEEANERSEKKITSNIRDNEKLESEIKFNMQTQEVKSTEIFNQQKTVSSVSNPELKKVEEEKLDKMEKEKKKLERQKDSLLKDIDNNEKENKELRIKIDLNNSDFIPAKKAEIVSQNEKVLSVTEKLKKIN
jgi:hypothetical protein